jgi:hypothetical protein
MIFSLVFYYFFPPPPRSSSSPVLLLLIIISYKRHAHSCSISSLVNYLSLLKYNKHTEHRQTLQNAPRDLLSLSLNIFSALIPYYFPSFFCTSCITSKVTKPSGYGRGASCCQNISLSTYSYTNFTNKLPIILWQTYLSHRHISTLNISW